MVPESKTLWGLGPDSGLEPPVRAFRTVLALAQRLRYLMDERLRGDGLTTQQAALLTVVAVTGNPSLAQAAAALGTTHQNVAQIVAALVRKGMLQVEPDPDDGRRKLLRTTVTNAAYWQARNDGDHKVVAGWFQDLTADEVSAFCDVADRVLARLGKAGDTDE